MSMDCDPCKVVFKPAGIDFNRIIGICRGSKKANQMSRICQEQEVWRTRLIPDLPQHALVKSVGSYRLAANLILWSRLKTQ